MNSLSLFISLGSKILMISKGRSLKIFFSMVFGVIFHCYRPLGVIFHRNRHTFPITTMVYNPDVSISLPYANCICGGD